MRRASALACFGVVFLCLTLSNASEIAAPFDSAESGTSTILQTTVDLIQDGSFELGSPNPYWLTSVPWSISTSGWCSPRTGSWFAHLGDGEGWVEQTVTFPPTGPVTLVFYMAHVFNEVEALDPGLRTPPADMLTVYVDSTPIESIPWYMSGYQYYALDLSGFADGGFHTLRFWFNANPDHAFCLDDVSMTAPAIPQSERDALVALYSSTNGAGWATSTGWLGPRGSECSWAGVVCTSDGGHVRQLNLQTNNLAGTIPWQLGALTSLAWLQLQENALTGGIPSEIGSLTALYFLNLRDNQLSGAIPDQLGALGELVAIGLNNNHLTGSIPATLGFLANVQVLALGSNQLSGGIPPELGNLSFLTHLQLRDNQLSGAIPPELGNLGNLVYLWLDTNQLAGEIPTSLGNLVNLGDQQLFICQNQLYTDDPVLSAFLDQKAEAGWATCQIPTVRFDWAPVAPHVGEPAQFTDTTTAAPTSWSWAFGDGGTSTQQHPSHAWASAGVRTVTLTASNAIGSDSASAPVNVVDVVPDAAFTWAPTVAGVGESVQFTDASSGHPTSWAWGFGDGATSTAQHPSHAFAGAGQYQVSLTVTNTAGSDVVAHTIEVSNAPVAAFSWSPLAPTRGEPVQFLDESSGQPTSWSWVFGDGGASSLQNPRHMYNAAGEYEITLTVANPAGSDSVSHRLVVGTPPEAAFTWTPAEPEVGDTVLFTDQSTNQPDSWWWEFGDGATSPYRNERHVYTAAGVYEVRLTVANVAGTDSVVHPVVVAEPTTTLELSWSPLSPRPGEPVTFTLVSNAGAPTAVVWDFGAAGCSGSPRSATCTTTAAGCDGWMHRFASPGSYSVSAVATVAGQSLRAAAAVTVAGAGSCDQGPRCGDSTCDATESGLVCPADCPGECGNLVCEVGEDPCSCASDCQPVCGNGICESGEGWVECGEDCERPDDFAGGGVETCRHCLVPAAVGLEPGLAGTLWKGEAMLSNLDPEAPLVFWSEFTSDAPGAKDDVMVSDPEVLEPGETRYFASFVEEVFGVSGGGNIQLMADSPMVVTTRVYNTGDDGTYGQLVDAFDASSIVCPGQMAILIGLEQDAAFRTNVFVQEVSGVGATFELEVHGPDSHTLGEVVRTATAGRTLRVPLGEVPGAAGMDHGYATVRVTAGGRVAVIASVVDNATGDAVTVKPIVIGRMGASKDGDEVHALVPVVARADGFAGTVWRSELILVNPDATQPVRLVLHASDGRPPVERTIALGGRGMVVDPDVVRTMLGDVEAQGSLHVYSATPLAVDSRTRNLGPTGTYGDSLKGLRSGDLLHPGQSGSLELLESSATFRTNIGFANYGSAEASVELTLFQVVDHRPLAVASTSYTVPAMRTLQVNKVFEALGVPQARPAKAAVTVLSGGPVYVYASKVDNATGDPTNVIAVPRP